METPTNPVRFNFRVITVRRGKLVTLKAPGNSTSWPIDSSYSFNHGWTRSVSKGTVSMTSRYAQRRNTSKHDLTTRRYVWRSGAWRLASSKKSVVTNSTGGNVGGWRVPGLKRYPSF